MISKALELRKLLRNRYLSPPDLRALQERKLRAVIRHAYENVSYYRSLFRSAGLSPEDVRTIGDLKYVPITTKEDLRAAGVERTTARGVDLASCRLRRSSGSSGKPFVVYLNHREARTRRLAFSRDTFTIGLHPRDRICNLRPVSLPPGFLGRLGLYRYEQVSYLLPIEEQIRHLQRIRPTVLKAWPTLLRAIMHQVDYRLSEIARPRLLITSGEVLDEQLKKWIQADIDVEMFNLYTSVEFGAIAQDCPAHEGLHVNADQLILECIQDDGQPAEPGKPGVAVLTGLCGVTMPFIRYRQGDILTLLEEQCSCGSSFPLIGPPLGRQDDVIRLPSGKILSAVPLFLLTNEVDGIDQYRFIQESLEHFVLQLKLQEHPGEEVLLQLRAQLVEYLGEPVRLDIQIVDFIQEDTRKFRKFISKLPQSDFSHT